MTGYNTTLQSSYQETLYNGQTNPPSLIYQGIFVDYPAVWPDIIILVILVSITLTILCGCCMYCHKRCCVETPGVEKRNNVMARKSDIKTATSRKPKKYQSLRTQEEEFYHL